MKGWRYYWAWLRHFVGPMEIFLCLGCALVFVGVFWIYQPAGLICGGLELLAIGCLGARKGF